MTKKVQRKGDKNTGGGAITEGESSVTVDGKPIAVHGKSVDPHKPGGVHNSARTVASQSKITANGRAVVMEDDTDTCGDKRTGGSSTVSIG